MGQKKTNKEIAPTNKKRVQPPRAVKAQRSLNPKKRVGPWTIVEKEEPEEPPRKTTAGDRLISRPPSCERMLSPLLNSDRMGSETTDNPIPESRCSQTQQNSGQKEKKKKRVSCQIVIDKERPPSSEGMLTSQLYLKTVHSETDWSSSLSSTGGGSENSAYYFIDVLCHSVGVKKVTIDPQKSRRSICEAMHILKRIPAIQERLKSKDYKLYFWAFELLVENPIKVDIFCALPANSERMEWLATEHKAQILRCRMSNATPGLFSLPTDFPPPPYE